MDSQVFNKKRVAKNAFALYIRMGVSMLVALYTSRIILANLGIVDYGIYNVVSSVVVMFTFLNSALGEASQRFFLYEIGRGDKNKCTSYFRASVNLHFIIAIIILLLCEFIGLWFLNTKLNIPSERLSAAKWVFQFSIFSAIVGILSVPYNAIIISYEKMNVFALISLIEVFLKLIIAYVISITAWDRLILYAILFFFVQFIIRIIYGTYCTYKIDVAKYRFELNGKILKEMSSFASFYLLGYVCFVFNNQGLKILLNIFIGPVINAAMGIAEQITNALTSFRTNLQTAINPQITKTYANTDINSMRLLIISSMKISFYIIWIIALPFFFYSDYILSLWLKNVPEYTSMLCKLSIIVAIIQAINNPIVVSIGAIGDIKKIFLIVNIINICLLPIGYLLLKAGYSPYYVVATNIILLSISFFISLLFLHKKINFYISLFFKQLFIHFFFVIISSISIGWIFFYLLKTNLWSLLLFLFLVTTANIMLIYTLGITSNDRAFINEYIKKGIRKS